MRLELSRERPRDRAGAVAVCDPQPERRHGAVERQLRAPESGDEDGEERPGRRLDSAAGRAARELRRKRKERQGANRPEERAGDQCEVPARVTPGQRRPRDAEDPEEERQSERDVPEREEADDEGERERSTGEGKPGRGGSDRQP